MTPQERLYDDLKRQYDLTSDRRKALTSQATSIMGFAGIVETILIASIISAATSPDARQLLTASPLYTPLLVFAGVGFAAYVFATYYSLRAFWEPRWRPAPFVPKVPNKDRFESISYFWDDANSRYEAKMLAQQLGEGIDYNQNVNDRKFDYLKKAFFGLMVGIISSAIGGILFLLMAM